LRPSTESASALIGIINIEGEVLKTAYVFLDRRISENKKAFNRVSVEARLQRL
jgi:hypothetical protein